MAARKSFVCKCAFERNIFVKKLERHFTYRSEEEFSREYRDEFLKQGLPVEQFQDIIEEIKNEISRRRQNGEKSMERRKFITENYHHIHPELLKLKEDFFATEFLDLVKLASSPAVNQEQLIQKISSEKAPRTYSFKVFTNDFCDKLIEELENFECSGLPRGKPNTMNNYGILLAELGYYEHFINPLVSEYLNPIAKLLYPECVGDMLDSNRTFVVSYAIGKDTDLSYHYDDAEVTLNVSLGKAFEDGELYLGGMNDEYDWRDKYFKYCHRKTYGLIHRGQQMHGAMPIDDGERYNLIIWMRSSSIRNKKCPMCHEKPDLIEVVGEGGGFTADDVDVCQLT